MKKYIINSSVYAFLGIASGVFFREYTKINNFDGTTKLSFVHPHLLILGMLFFLIVLILNALFNIDKRKSHTFFLFTYNTGLLITSIMLLIKGILEVNKNPNYNSSILSGLAGIGHIIFLIGLIFFFINLFKSIIEYEKNKLNKK